MSLWLSKSLLRAVEDRLSEGERGPLVVLDFPLMSRALSQAGYELAQLSESGESAVAAVIVDALARREDWSGELRTLRTHLQPGGQFISVDKSAPEEVSRRLLCGGFSDLRQQTVGRRLLTSAVLPPA